MMSIEEKQKQVLKDFRKGSKFKVGDKALQFARATEENLKAIQEMSTEDLIIRYHDLLKVMEIGFSLMDCELEILMALEMEKRKVTEEQYKEVVSNARRKMEAKESK